MTISKEKLIEKYTKAICEGNAAIFAGAGLSRASGYVDWKNLLKPLAREINLDIEEETDLLSVAQYYRNETGNRAAINQEILDSFTKEAKTNENIEIIARLPISTYWTTNYDQLIEDELKRINKKVDVKYDSDQLPYASHNRDAVVYKMHGDVNHPANAVLTKDDYVLYEKRRPLFRTLLRSDLISKKFLFLGFSFEDPNFDYILNQIHLLLGENISEHYCFFKRVSRKDCASDERYGYQKAKQELRIRDLARCGIQTVLVEEFSEITEVLRKIEIAVRRRNIFISGSACDYGDWGEKAEELAEEIASGLIRKEFRLTSGFGNGIGAAIVNGALSEIYRSKHKNISEYLCLRPFTKNIKNKADRDKMYTQYRKDMLADTGIAIFIFGNKKNPDGTEEIIDATGCWEEFQIAKNNGSTIIPIGSTGFTAQKISDEIKKDMKNYEYLKEYIDILDNEKDVRVLVETIVTIVERACKI